MKKQISFVVAIALLLSPAAAKAAINSLGGQTGATQTFANDTNVTINSSGDVHTLGWSGVLQGSRGGTGVDLTSFTEGSILFYNGSEVAESANLFWDDTNNLLQLGGDITFLPDGTPTDRLIKVGDQTVANTNGNSLIIKTGQGDGVGNGGTVAIKPGDGGNGGNGGELTMFGGNAGTTAGDGGSVSITAGAGSANNGNGGNILIQGGETDSGVSGAITIETPTTGAPGGGQIRLQAASAHTPNVSGSDITIIAGNGNGSGNTNGGSIILETGIGAGSGTNGIVRISNSEGRIATLDVSSITINNAKNFIFPDAPGTFTLLESDQIFSGLNKFEDSSNTTIYVGSNSLTGCIAMGDSDGSGITYITANNGVISSTTSKPGICQ